MYVYAHVCTCMYVHVRACMYVHVHACACMERTRPLCTPRISGWRRKAGTTRHGVAMRAHQGILVEKKTSTGVANGDRWADWRAEKTYRPLRSDRWWCKRDRPPWGRLPDFIQWHVFGGGLNMARPPINIQGHVPQGFFGAGGAVHNTFPQGPF